jgi:ferredoxin
MFNSYTTTTLQYDPALCINCDLCSEVCPHGVFARGVKFAKLVNPSACMECGACMLNCPTAAINVKSGVGCATAMMIAALRGKRLDDATCGVDIDDHGSKTVPDCCGGNSDCCG